MSLKHWIHGLAAAFIGGVASGVPVCIVDPKTFNIHEGWKALIEVCLANGIFFAAAYLKQSPLPSDESTTGTTTTINQPKP